jgi:DKNYY family
MNIFKPLLALLSLTVVILTGCGDSGYQRDGSDWTYDGIPFAPLDPTTFQPLDSRFARDARSGYYRGSEIAGSEGRTFESLSDNEARDQNSVFYCDTYRKGQEYWAYQHLRMTRIPEADPPTYRVLGYNYSRDAAQVYFEGVAFPVKDVATFEPFNRRFARDAKRGYFERAEIPGSDGPTFSMADDMDLEYARDQKTVYHAHTETTEPNKPPHRIVRTLSGVDMQKFRALGRGYASDGTHVWFRGELLSEADAPSFNVGSESPTIGDAQDRKGAWEQGRRKPAS